MALFQQDEAVQTEEIKDGFALLPNGAYDATVYEVEVGEFKSEKNFGKPRLVATIRIAEGPYKGRQLKDFAIPLFTEEGNDWANRTSKQFFLTGLGFESFEDIPDDVEDLLGMEVKVLIGTEKDDQSDEDRNRIKRYLPDTAETSNGEGGVVAKEPAKKARKKPSGKL